MPTRTPYSYATAPPDWLVDSILTATASASDAHRTNAHTLRRSVLVALGEQPLRERDLLERLGPALASPRSVGMGILHLVLRQLEKDGLICAPSDEGADWQITEQGRDSLAHEDVGDAADQMSTRGDWIRWAGPEAALFAGPLGRVINETVTAARTTSTEQWRRLTEILDRCSAEIHLLPRIESNG
jgi:hypothetical protein